jgi:parallel beta-helix repeat protein
MLKTIATILIGTALMFAAPAFAVDGVALINQATVMAAGGFPYVITQPGSYKLSGNLVVSAANTRGIDIMASNVSIDLNGFTISGPVTCTGFGSSISCVGIGGTGISALSSRINVAVRNGSVVGFATGISLGGNFNNLVQEVQASGNSFDGLVVSNGLVRRNTASGNGGSGISATDSTVTENLANFNGRYGLEALFGMYGSNTFDRNGAGPVFNDSGAGAAVSQNNNGCNGIAC